MSALMCLPRRLRSRSPQWTTEIMEEAAALKKLAAAVKGANLPSIKSAKLSSLDNNVSVAKRSASSVNLFGLSEEVF